MNDVAFTFDDVRVRPDRQIGSHSHHQWELSHVIRGTGTRSIGNRTETVEEGEVILVPPDIPHVWLFDSDNVDSDGCIANITILFNPQLIDDMSRIFPELKPRLRHISMISEAKSYLGDTRKNIISTLLSMRGLNAETRLPYMIRLFTMLAETDDSRGVGCNNVLTRVERRLEGIRTFCSCNYNRNITLDEVAAYAAMNKSAFCMFMKKHTGMTFSEFVNDYRLRKACDALRDTDDNISDIAYSVGFANVTYFNRLFRARYGCTPKIIRNERNRP